MMQLPKKLKFVKNLFFKVRKENDTKYFFENYIRKYDGIFP